MLKRCACLAARCILRMKFQSFIGVTATPMLNRVDDYHGYLVQFARTKELFSKINLPKKDQMYELYFLYDSWRDHYKEWLPKGSHRLHNRLEEANNAGYPLQMLCPQAFRLVGGRTKWDTTACRGVLRPIIALTQMRRLMSRAVETTPGNFVTPGGDIPPHRMLTVELKMSPGSKAKYDRLTMVWRDRIGDEDLSPEDDPDISMDTNLNKLNDRVVALNAQAYRGLMHTTFDMSLACLTARVQEGISAGTSKEVNSWKERDNDHGMTFKFERSKMSGSEARFPPYQDRLSMAFACIVESPKLMYIANQLFQWKKEGHRAVIFFNWPMCQW